MIWPEHLLSKPPIVFITPGYKIRTFKTGDETRFFEIMNLAGWPGWDQRKLHPWLYRILPGGWFLVIHESDNRIVASCMATHDHTWITPFCGELAWLAGDPAHAGIGLGMAVSASVTNRFIEAGYGTIHLCTEPYRLAALKIYLKLGFRPFVEPAENLDLWKEICLRLNWPFTPDDWKAKI